MNFFEKLRKLSKLQLIFLILAVGFVVYFNSLFNGFVWDDEEQILNNVAIRSFSNLPLIFKSSTFSTGGAGLSGWYYKPLMTASFMLNYSIWRLNPFGFHLFQVLLHLINAVLVFLLFSALFKPPLVSFFLALVFAVHPVNSESVVYISAVQEVLFTFFVLGGFLILLKFKTKKSLITGAFLIFLALLSKETAILAIPIILVYFLLFEKDKVFSWIFSSLAILSGYLILRVGIAKIPFAHFSIVPISEATFSERLLTIPWEITYYLRVLLFPRILATAQHTVIKNPADFSFWGLGILVLIFLSATIWTVLKLRSKLFYFFVFWFFCSLVLILNIFPLDMTVAERWLYFPLIGFLGMMGIIFAWINQSFPSLSRLFIILSLVAIVSLGLRTIVRNSNWRSGLSLYEHDIKINKTAFDLQNNYGVELFRVGRIDEAKIHFERSISLQPKWWTSFNNLGAVYERKGDFSEAEKMYQKSIENGNYYLAYEN
ncbi:hypothetical protein COU95_02015, partial [Candidatus Shapirobacteria bacterium CG10_big_fil_rev_8_21_14_0_10_40_9]